MSTDIWTHWVALYVQNNVSYFDSFGSEHIPKEIKAFIKNKNIATNIFRIQAYYFLAEIRERELISKKISKYIASLGYFGKSLNVLSILSSISIASFATVIGAPAAI